jgi:stage II sporulation protein D
MKKTAKLGFTMILALAITLASFSLPNAKAYAPPYTTVKIGLYYGGSALPSANLENVSGCGSGYQFGILDNSRNFTPIGASTAETKISMLRDKNMVYDSSNRRYNEGTTGSVVVGCYHVQMNTAFSSYAEAQAAVSAYPGSFVKYSNGSFFGCVGNYTTADAASAAAGGIPNSTVTSGTSSTVAVVKTGTNTMLFEFEYGSAYWLVVMPMSQGGAKTQTWFKNYKYYGGFQYARIGGEDLTVINVVNVEDYTKGVIPYEMVGNAPLEAYKAQAVCARTYAMANLGKHTGFDLCPTEDCQVYHGINQSTATTAAAVDQTAGQYMTYNGQLATGYYASSDGGATENSENVWNEAVPYLRGVVDPYEADIAGIAPGYSWTVTYTSAEITSRLQSKGYQIGTVVGMTVSQLTDSGNVYKVTVTDSGGNSLSFKKGDPVRSALGVKSIHFTINGGASSNDVYVNSSSEKLDGGLQSSYAIGGGGLAEIIGVNKPYAITGTGETVQVGTETQSASGSFTIKGTGNGHSIGMSQWGAYSMAKFHNMTYDQILKFYYTGVSIG